MKYFTKTADWISHRLESVPGYEKFLEQAQKHPATKKQHAKELNSAIDYLMDKEKGRIAKEQDVWKQRKALADRGEKETEELYKLRRKRENSDNLVRGFAYGAGAAIPLSLAAQVPKVFSKKLRGFPLGSAVAAASILGGVGSSAIKSLASAAKGRQIPKAGKYPSVKNDYRIEEGRQLKKYLKENPDTIEEWIPKDNIKISGYIPNTKMKYFEKRAANLILIDGRDAEKNIYKKNLKMPVAYTDKYYKSSSTSQKATNKILKELEKYDPKETVVVAGKYLAKHKKELAKKHSIKEFWTVA